MPKQMAFERDETVTFYLHNSYLIEWECHCLEFTSAAVDSPTRTVFNLCLSIVYNLKSNSIKLTLRAFKCSMYGCTIRTECSTYAHTVYMELYHQIVHDSA